MLGSIVGNRALPDKLKALYAHFEPSNRRISTNPPALGAPVPMVTVADTRSSFSSVSLWKATGWDGVPGRVLRACADQLAEVFTDIVNISLLHSDVPTCFKTFIILVPRKSKVVHLND